MTAQEREALILDNMPLVTFIAKKYLYAVQLNAVIDFADLQQEGTIGLIKAIDRFDPALGCVLSTFAYPYIQGHIHNLVERSSAQWHRPRDAKSYAPIPPECSLDNKDTNWNPGGQDDNYSIVEIKLLLEQTAATPAQAKLCMEYLFEGRTQTELAETYHTTQVTVSRTVTRTLERLKEKTEQKKVKTK